MYHLYMQNVHILLDEKLLKLVDDYRFKKKLESRTAAIRELVAKGLKGGGDGK